MKKQRFLIFWLMLLFVNGEGVSAQVKRVQMHIDGYLCGN
jgi:hypothetical protein